MNVTALVLKCSGNDPAQQAGASRQHSKPGCELDMEVERGKVVGLHNVLGW